MDREFRKSKLNLNAMLRDPLDGEILWNRYWLEFGKARSLRKLARSAGINKVTGRPYTTMSGDLSMWRWAVRPKNHEKAEKIFMQAMRDQGEHYSHDEWMQLLSRKALTLAKISTSSIELFMKNCGL